MAKEEGQSSGSPTDKKSALARSSSRVPYHMATIPRPQEEFNIRANNLNEPFQHVWLQTSDDGSRVMHPLERFSLFDFANTNTGSVDPIKPLPMECTAFKLVETVKDLKDLVSKLHDVNEFAVDLEHNKYRSFQGLTCLMQISTRTEDFVVDTLKLRIHIGPYLREFFKDPSKKKVMHGADCDVLWLQRDFSIYVCNLFDTGQASRVLQLERNSLEYLLSYFCAVTVNKEYQSADWRQRPLPDEMLKYAREDTHYLLYIYDIMRGRLISASRNSKDGNDLLLEVYKRSYDVCLQLYEKELFTDTSYLHIYGLQSTDLNAQQLSVVAGLCEWRDKIARLADESTGYILPNKALLEIAKQMPLTASKLRKLVKSKHPYVELNLISVLGIIKDSVKMSASFEITAQELQRAHLETVTAQETVVSNELEAFRISEVPTHMLKMPSVSPVKSERENINRANGPENKHLSTSIHIKEEHLQLGGCISGCSRVSQGSYFELSGDGGVVKKELVGHPQDIFKESSSVSRQIRDTKIKMADLRPEKSFAGSTVQVPNKPSPNFGAFFENSSSQRKFNADPKDNVDQIKSIILPFDLLNGRNKHLKPFAVNSSREIQHPREHVSVQAGMTKLKDVSLGYKPFHMNISQGIQQRNHQPFYDFPRATSACLANRGSPGTSALENVNDVSVSQELESDLQPKTIPFPEVREEMIYGEHQDEDARIEYDGGHKDLLTSRERCRNSEISKVLRDKETEFAAG